MLPPAELLEQALQTHGDTLYRVAMLLGADERSADILLRRFALAWREAPPLTPPDEPALLARLVATHAAAPARPARSRWFERLRTLRAPNTPRAPSPIPLPLALHVLLGYDAARIGRVLGADQASARAALIEAVAASAHRFGLSLPDRVSGELCDSVRATLADPTANSRHAGVVRGHLATCSFCRAWDQSWIAIVQAAEGELRGSLRDLSMPPALVERLLASVRPARRRLSPSLRLALPPLAVLALIVGLVLPGFLRPSTRVVERDLQSAVEPQTLIERALARHGTAPDRGGIWYGRYSTQWYFSDDTYAPLTAEVWLDPDNPARHRLQLTHSAGGAPYELQLANGRDRLYYALDATYAPALYGGLTTRARPEEPALLAENLDAEGQRRALGERLATGPWSIPPFYLRQAQAAADLRVLGRQRDGDNTVQILSFSGVSPLGLPPDAPGATAERVTVLLALDLDDGLLRSATELAGPAGAEQTSRVTWRLEREQWLATSEQIGAAFDIGRAWTGMGDFSELGRHTSADLAMPLISARTLGNPASLLDSYNGFGSFWMPSAAPPGVERALFLWPAGAARSGTPPQGLVYLGDGRRLVIAFNIVTRLDGEQVRADPWDGSLRPGRGGRYTMLLSRRPEVNGAPRGFDPSANLLIDTIGFTRAEILGLVESLRPFDLTSLAAQNELFTRGDDAEARAILLRVVRAATDMPTGSVGFTLTRQYVRHAPNLRDARADPYHAPPYEGRPEETALAEWFTVAPAPAIFRQTNDPRGETTRLASFYLGSDEAWRASETTGALQRFAVARAPQSAYLPYIVQSALDLLTLSGGELTAEQLPNGGTLIRHSAAIADNPEYAALVGAGELAEPHLFDLRPETITVELELNATGDPVRSRVFAGLRGGERELVVSQTLVERAVLPFEAAPEELRTGVVPEMAYVADFRSSQERPTSVVSTTTRSITETLALSEQPLYVLAGLEPLFVEEGDAALQARGLGDALDQAIGQGVARRLTYRAPVASAAADPPSYYLRITQGQASRFGGYLRSLSYTPWTVSEPITLSVAGEPVDAWLGQGQTAYLLMELDGTLLIVEAPRIWFHPDNIALLDALAPAARP